MAQEIILGILAPTVIHLPPYILSKAASITLPLQHSHSIFLLLISLGVMADFESRKLPTVHFRDKMELRA